MDVDLSSVSALLVPVIVLPELELDPDPLPLPLPLPSSSNSKDAGSKKFTYREGSSKK